MHNEQENLVPIIYNDFTTLTKCTYLYIKRDCSEGIVDNRSKRGLVMMSLTFI